MRAVYIEHFKSEDDLTLIDGEKAHHLINVIRIKKDQKILVLDGVGSKWLGKVVEVKKRSIAIQIIEYSDVVQNTNRIHIAIALLKKDAMDLALKQAVELGTHKVSIIETEQSQKYKINKERNSKILISALEQSNSLFLPEIEYTSLTDLIQNVDNQIIYLSSIDGEKVITYGCKDLHTLLIGPEAGMSVAEEDNITKLSNVNTVKFPTNILRAPTALSTGYGYLLGKMHS